MGSIRYSEVNNQPKRNMPSMLLIATPPLNANEHQLVNGLCKNMELFTTIATSGRETRITISATHAYLQQLKFLDQLQKLLPTRVFTDNHTTP